MTISITGTSRAALIVSLLCSAPALAQEVRGPEAAPTSNAPSPASTAGDPAQDQSAANANQLGEIVVTARRVAENLQSVPVAVTAFTGAQLQQQSVTRVSDVARLTPGLYVRDAQSTGAAVTFQLRGQVQTDILATLDPSVGVYVDGLYWSRAYGINTNLLDIQSFQTLKGPQGTLFGRNTTGGAILIQTNDPDLNSFSGLVSGTYGRFNERGGTAVLNLPIIEDKLAIRGAFQIQKRDGYVNNVVTTLGPASTGPVPGTFRGGTSGGSRDLGEINNYTGRVKLLAKPTDNLSLLISGEIFRTKFLNTPFRIGYVAKGITPGTNGYLASMQAANDLGTTLAAGNAYLQNYINIAQNTDADTVSLAALPQTYARTRTLSGTATLDTFFGAIKFITGYRDVRSSSGEDLIGVPIRLLTTLGVQDLSQLSGELQFTGKAFNDAVDFAAGAFYFSEHGTDGSMSPTFLSFSASQNQFDGQIRTRSQGVYAQASYHITDKLSFTGGLRYSIEDKGIISRNRSLNRGTGVVTCTLLGATLANLCALTRRDSFSGISYTAGLDYKISDDVLVYAKTSKGFRSGGQNLRAVGALSAFQPFAPEIARQHEAGIKSEFLDRRVRVNAAGYYTTVDNLQRSTIVTSGTTSATIVSNAGKARIYGGEIEANAVVFDGFVLGGTAALTEFKYLKYRDPNTGADRRNERVESIPKWTYTITGSYTHDFGDVKFLLRGDYIWTDTVNFQPYNNDGSFGSPVDPDNALIVAATQAKAQGLVNARASLTFLDGNLEVAVFGRNLTDKRDITASLFFAPGTSIASNQRRAPRTFGVTGTFKFGS